MNFNMTTVADACAKLTHKFQPPPEHRGIAFTAQNMKLDISVHDQHNRSRLEPVIHNASTNGACSLNNYNRQTAVIEPSTSLRKKEHHTR